MMKWSEVSEWAREGFLRLVRPPPQGDAALQAVSSYMVIFVWR